MSDKMNKLKEVAGENELDKDQLDLIAGGNVAQTEELWNFYMNHGAESFLKKYKNNHAKGVLEVLKQETSGDTCTIASIANATAKEGDNIYKLNGGFNVNHSDLMSNLNAKYKNGDGFFGQAN